MKKQNILLTLVPVIGVLALSGTVSTAVAAERGGADVAAVSMTAPAIYWSPQGSYAQITLTVSGPEGVTSEVFPSGVSPSFRAGNRADGSYTYELTVTPIIDNEARAYMSQARESGDTSAATRMRQQGILPSGPTSQSGYFRIMNGAIFTDQSREES